MLPLKRKPAVILPFVCNNNEHGFLKEIAPYYMRASKEHKLDNFLKALQEIWIDHFPQPVSILASKRFEDAKSWANSIRHVMVWTGSILGNSRQNDEEVVNWQGHMTLETDCLYRRTNYYAYAQLRTYLQGPQYSNHVVSLAERALCALIEKSDKKVFQYLVNKFEGDYWGASKLTAHTKVYQKLLASLEENIWGAGHIAWETSGNDLGEYMYEQLMRKAGNNP
ncbi:hypothetical protein C0991_011946 [Blastosporella zonata]|nr:hypothetical protein C0991_011946 [Blastosporella zonata]